MTKYYKAEVKVEQTFIVNIAAEDEKLAKQKVRGMDFSKLSPKSSLVSDVNLILDGETDYEIGTKIKYFIFGVGEIKSLKRTTNSNNDFGFSASINFERGETKNILMFPSHCDGFVLSSYCFV